LKQSRRRRLYLAKTKTKMKVTVLASTGEYSPLPPPFSLSSLCSCVFRYGFSPQFSLLPSLCLFLFALCSPLLSPSVFLFFLPPFLCRLLGIYRDQCSYPSAYISPPNKHDWGSRFLLGLGRNVQSLSHRVVIIMKIKIALLCFDMTRMLVFHNFLFLLCRQAFGVWRRRTTPDWNSVVFGPGMTIFNLVLEVLKFCIQNPDLLISRFTLLKIRLKSQGVKIML